MTSPQTSRDAQRAAFALLAAACLAASLAACALDGTEPPPAASGSPASRPAFDGRRAYRELEALQALGPRPPGSPGSRRAGRHLARLFEALGARASTQAFRALDPDENRWYDMVNHIFRFHGDLRPRLLLGTHYDTRRYADLDPDPANRTRPVPGANDGGSGVAVLLELGRLLSLQAPPVGVDVVLFDGEDFGRPGTDYYCRGSCHFAENPPAFVTDPGVEAAVILDLVGDRDLAIHAEGYSVRTAPDLVGRFWSAASRAGAGDVFHRSVKYTLRDDHTALHETLGIPAILVIDFDYDAYFHTVRDTVDKCSAASLQKAGDALAEFVYSYSEQPR